MNKLKERFKVYNIDEFKIRNALNYINEKKCKNLI